MEFNERPLLELLGQNMREARVQAGMTRPEAAAHFGTTPTTIYRWETATRAPDVTNVHLAASIYSVAVSDLVPEPEEVKAYANTQEQGKADAAKARRGK